jgi:c-di-GMP-binding flagellar brake protein YcgR
MADESVAEQRRSRRDTEIVPGITSFVESNAGSTLEGVVRDVSDGGVKIAGATTGLSVGDEVQLVLVLAGNQKVGCRCDVRHIELGETYGLKFRSQPQPITERRVARCTYCDREFSPDLRYCGYCGGRLRHITL